MGVGAGGGCVDNPDVHSGWRTTAYRTSSQGEESSKCKLLPISGQHVAPVSCTPDPIIKGWHGFQKASWCYCLCSVQSSVTNCRELNSSSCDSGGRVRSAESAPGFKYWLHPSLAVPHLLLLVGSSLCIDLMKSPR